MRKYFSCPACGSKMSYHGSRLQSNLLRTSYAQCSNEQCRAEWRLNTEITKCISAPLAPYPNPLDRAKSSA